MAVNKQGECSSLNKQISDEEEAHQETHQETQSDSRHSCWKDQIDEKWLMDEEVASLSKNQQKKLLKKKLFQQTRLQKRKQERERKKEKRTELREAGLPLPKRMKRKDMIGVKYSDITVGIDLDYYDLMNENDLRMVVKQVKNCYADNRRVKNPIQLHLTSFCGSFKDLFMSLQPGSANWDLSKSEKSYREVFTGKNIVYLTADSDNVLETVDENSVYIIGGLVDHNQHKGLCYKRAIENGISHAQLPISKYVTLSTRKVLTINHVFEILLQFKEIGVWKEAFFKVIPRRKGIDEIEKEDKQFENYDNTNQSILDNKNPVVQD